MGEEVRRLEEGGDGGEQDHVHDHVHGQGVVRGKRKHGGEGKECIPLTEGGGGGEEGEQRRRRKGGRISNLMKTFELGEKQRNKITFYILKKDGHPTARAKLLRMGWSGN